LTSGCSKKYHLGYDSRCFSSYAGEFAGMVLSPGECAKVSNVGSTANYCIDSDKDGYLVANPICVDLPKTKAFDTSGNYLMKRGAAASGVDCDDKDFDTNPGVEEYCDDDNKDNNCNGESDVFELKLGQNASIGVNKKHDACNDAVWKCDVETRKVTFDLTDSYSRSMAEYKDKIDLDNPKKSVVKSYLNDVYNGGAIMAEYSNEKYKNYKTDYGGGTYTCGAASPGDFVDPTNTECVSGLCIPDAPYYCKLNDPQQVLPCVLCEDNPSEIEYNTLTAGIDDYEKLESGVAVTVDNFCDNLLDNNRCAFDDSRRVSFMCNGMKTGCFDGIAPVQEEGEEYVASIDGTGGWRGADCSEGSVIHPSGDGLFCTRNEEFSMYQGDGNINGCDCFQDFEPYPADFCCEIGGEIPCKICSIEELNQRDSKNRSCLRSEWNADGGSKRAKM
jgi:hypothetical protein